MKADDEIADEGRGFHLTAGFAALAAALVLGVTVAHVAMPAIFHAVPTDLSRVRAILEVLRRDDLSPRIVFFGSSVIASALDTAFMTERLPEEPLALNLSSAQQSAAESYLFYQELPQSVRVIVQALTPRELMNGPQLTRNRLNAYYMYGYRPDDRTKQFLARSLTDEATPLLASSDAEQRFVARWSVHRMLDTGQWRLRTHLPDVDRWAEDVFFSELFQTRLAEQEFERTLRWWVSTWTAPDARLGTELPLILHEMAARAADEGRRLVVLVPPMHPRVRDRIPSAFLTQLGDLLEGMRRRGVEIVDASETMPDAAFRDCIHLLRGSAPRLTELVVERINAS